MSNTNKPLSAEEVLQAMPPRPAHVGGESYPQERCICAMEQYAAQQTAALREELQGEKVLVGVLSTAAKELEKELEAVKKERDGLKMQRVKDADDFLTVLQQRDEAVTFLQNLPAAWRNDKMNEFLARLSSGETKPAGPWIKVEDRLPEPYKEVYAGSFDEDGDFGQTVCWHTGEHWEGNEITEDSMITHWTHTLPAPPESLTDKK